MTALTATVREVSEIHHSARDSRAVTFIEPNMAEINRLLKENEPSIETIVLDGFEPAPLQMARALANRTELSAVHWITQGRTRAVRFTSKELQSFQIDEHSAAWRQIGNALSRQGSLILWSCESAGGNGTQTVVGALASC